MFTLLLTYPLTLDEKKLGMSREIQNIFKFDEFRILNLTIWLRTALTTREKNLVKIGPLK